MPTVMVVDDAAVDRRLAGGLLENAPNLNVCYAHDGEEALIKIGQEMPDLVVTDLQMPHVDGLALVNSLQERYPEVPVVLMTAQGSEVIAAQALANGAASYIPKNELAASLVETVMQILAMTNSDTRYRKLIGCATKTEFEFLLENDFDIIEPLIELIQQVNSSQGTLDSAACIRIGVAVEHALSNAMFRGNLEMSREQFPVLNRSIVRERLEQVDFDDRKVFFRMLVTADAVRFTIKDDGPGFDTTSIPEASDPDSFRDGAGRGLVLIQTFMDRVEYDPKGNSVQMIKLRSENPDKPR